MVRTVPPAVMVIAAVLDPGWRLAEFAVTVKVTVPPAPIVPFAESKVSQENPDTAVQCAAAVPVLVNWTVLEAVLFTPIVRETFRGLELSATSGFGAAVLKKGSSLWAFALIAWQLFEGHRSGRTTAIRPT